LHEIGPISHETALISHEAGLVSHETALVFLTEWQLDKPILAKKEAV
jgi:hypothetical protein